MLTSSIPLNIEALARPKVSVTEISHQYYTISTSQVNSQSPIAPRNCTLFATIFLHT